MEEEKAELHLVATLENPDIPRGDKVTMLWAEPSSKTLQEQLKKWAGLLDTWEPYFRFRRDAPYPQGAGMTGKNLVALMDSMRGDGIKEVPCTCLQPLYEDAGKVAETKNQALAHVFQEQVVARTGADSDLPAPPEGNFEFSNCMRVAKELCKHWILALKRKTDERPLLANMAETFKDASDGKARRRNGDPHPANKAEGDVPAAPVASGQEAPPAAAVAPAQEVGGGSGQGAEAAAPAAPTQEAGGGVQARG